jgi:O-methyltransferase involved in polyketide biosynthesis
MIPNCGGDKELLMQTSKVHLTEEKETMLLALYSRAMESRSKDPLLRDTMAEEAIERIDYDFSRTKTNSIESLQVVLRSLQLDRWTSEFLAKHPETTVLQLGCGLDSRVYRLDPLPGVLWFDVDYPDVISLRQELYPARAGYHMIGSSVTDPGLLDEVPRDRLAWIVAEGLTYYLSESDAKTLLNRLTGHFPSGQIAFDAVNQQGAKLAKSNARIQLTGATIGWWIDDPLDIKRLDPKLELVTELRPLEAHKHDKLPGSFRALLYVLDIFPNLRRLNRLLRYQF